MLIGQFLIAFSISILSATIEIIFITIVRNEHNIYIPNYASDIDQKQHISEGVLFSSRLIHFYSFKHDAHQLYSHKRQVAKHWQIFSFHFLNWLKMSFSCIALSIPQWIYTSYLFQWILKGSTGKALFQNKKI